MPARQQRSKRHSKTIQPPVERLTHADRRERRRQIALALADGKTSGQVANEFGVTTATVRGAAAEFAELIRSGRKRVGK